MVVSFIGGGDRSTRIKPVTVTAGTFEPYQLLVGGLMYYCGGMLCVCLRIVLSNKGNNKITELRTILQRESQNS
jgi:hypothetical protein